MTEQNLSLANLVRIAQEAKDARDAAQAAYKDATDALVAAVGGETGTHTTSSGSFTLSENNTYPMAEVAKMLSKGQLQRVRSNALDPKKVAALYPDEYAAVKSTNGVKVTLR